MSDAFVLRRRGGQDLALSVQVEHDGTVRIEGVPGSARPLRVLRREPSGLLVALWGDEVVHGVLTNGSEAFALLVPTHAAQFSGLSLKPAAVDAMEQAVAASAGANGAIEVVSPIPGLIKQVKANPGEAVEEGQTLVVLEAMKMENEITAPHAGKVDAVHVKPGQSVGAGVVLAVLSVGSA